MKIVTYSEVPHKKMYVHLAYLSAAAENQATEYFGTAVLLALAYLFVAVVATAAGVPKRFPRICRWISLCVLAAILTYVFVSCFGPGLAGRHAEEFLSR